MPSFLVDKLSDKALGRMATTSAAPASSQPTWPATQRAMMDAPGVVLIIGNHWFILGVSVALAIGSLFTILGMTLAECSYCYCLVLYRCMSVGIQQSWSHYTNRKAVITLDPAGLKIDRNYHTNADHYHTMINHDYTILISLQCHDEIRSTKRSWIDQWLSKVLTMVATRSSL